MKSSAEGQPDSEPQSILEATFLIEDRSWEKKGFHAVSQRYPAKVLQGQHGLGAKLHTRRRRQTSVLVSRLIRADGFTCRQHQTFLLAAFLSGKEKRPNQPTPPSLCDNRFI